MMGWGTRGQSKTPIIKQSWEKGRGKEKTYPGAGYLYACCAFGDPGCGAPARTQNLFAFGLNSKIFFHHCFTAAAMTYDDCLVKNILRMSKRFGLDANAIQNSVVSVAVVHTRHTSEYQIMKSIQ